MWNNRVESAMKRPVWGRVLHLQVLHCVGQVSGGNTFKAGGGLTSADSEVVALHTGFRATVGRKPLRISAVRRRAHALGCFIARTSSDSACTHSPIIYCWLLKAAEKHPRAKETTGSPRAPPSKEAPHPWNLEGLGRGRKASLSGNPWYRQERLPFFRGSS